MAFVRKNIIAGRNPIVEALEHGAQLEKIFVQKNISGDVIRHILDLARQNAIPVQRVPVEKLNRISKISHQGVIALGGLIRYQDLQTVIDFVVSDGAAPLFVMLDGITDVRNIGAIARSAYCMGAQALIIPDKGMGALNEEAIKTSAGALEHLQVCRVVNLGAAIELLHLNGIMVLTSQMQAEKKLFDFDLQLPLCLIMGAEGSGVNPRLAEKADAYYRIPMKTFDSLNVSVAAAISLYEVLKQRSHD